MSIRKGTEKVFLILILLMGVSTSFGHNAKPDITADIRQSDKPESWNRTECCYPSPFYQTVKRVFKEKIYENESFMKIHDMLSKYWREHTHEQR